MFVNIFSHIPLYNNLSKDKQVTPKNIMSVQNILKDGNIHSFNIRQNLTNYILRIAHCPKGLWTCIQQSINQWKLTITHEIIQQTVSKASGGKQNLTYKQFLTHLVGAASKQNDSWSIGIMTPIQLQLLRGGNASKQANTNKIYLILSNKQKKLHYPFTLIQNELCQKEKLLQGIKKMKQQLQQLRAQRADKSQSSFSIMSQTMNQNQQTKLENEQMKKKIRIYEESLTQKRGAVQIDMILKQKNMLEIKAETKKREQIKQITRLKGINALIQRENKDIEHQVDIITKQLTLLQDNISNPAKLKTHALRVLKTYETQLRTNKKVVMKQTKEIQNLKRNILNSKNIQKRNLAKIKQIQGEIDQAKKKANVKEISNRLHSNSPGSRHGNSVASSNKAPSETSSQGKTRSYGSGNSGNLVRTNLLKKTNQSTQNKNHLMKTTPNINMTSGSPNIQRKSNQFKPPVRPIVSSHQTSKNIPSNRPSYQRSPASRSEKSQTKSVKSIDMKKKQFTPEQKQKQRLTILRLAGGKKASQENLLSQKILREDKSQNKGNISVKRQINRGQSLNNKNKGSTKDVLAKMKQVKAYYNGKVQIHAQNNKNIAAKIAQVTENI